MEGIHLLFEEGKEKSHWGKNLTTIPLGLAGECQSWALMFPARSDKTPSLGNKEIKW